MLGKTIGVGAAVTTLVTSAALLVQKKDAPRQAAAMTVVDRDGLRFQRIRLGTGVELRVAESGPSDGTPVLFLHGYADSWFSYSTVIPHLPGSIRAIVPTQRGHGDSERPRCCYRLHDFAADAVALLDALGVQRATVVGHSMGSFVAQRVAIDNPARVDRLVLIGSGATIRTPEALELAAFVATLPDAIDEKFVREFQLSTTHAPLPPDFFEGLIAESMKFQASAWRDVMSSMITSDAVNELGRIQAPTLVVWGEHDGLFKRHDQDALIGAIRDARLVAWSDASHSPQWEHPARFVEELMTFLGAAAGAAGAGVGAQAPAAPGNRP